MNQRNHLNSVLIEGEIVKESEYSENLRQCVFHIESNRYYKTGSGIEKEINYFTIQATGKAAEACAAGKKGRGIRVIGRIKSTQKNGEAIIIAENIDFKPEFKKGKNKEGENVE